jgi:catechol 2,3-dioxygenase-like lactoylglutathione lyase family enzyme
VTAADPDDGLYLSHVGLCVTDLDRSLRFYVEGLGFEPVASHTVGPEFGALMEVDGVRVASHLVRRDGVTLELLHFLHPGPGEPGSRRPLTRPGFTHLSLRVTDLEGTAARIAALGGEVVAGTRTTFDLGEARLDFVYCTDPDGTRVELMDLPGPLGPVG